MLKNREQYYKITKEVREEQSRIRQERLSQEYDKHPFTLKLSSVIESVAKQGNYVVQLETWDVRLEDYVEYLNNKGFIADGVAFDPYKRTGTLRVQWS